MAYVQIFALMSAVWETQRRENHYSLKEYRAKLGFLVSYKHYRSSYDNIFLSRPANLGFKSDVEANANESGPLGAKGQASKDVGN